MAETAIAETSLHAVMNGRTRVFPLIGRDVWWIGRNHDCDIMLDDHRASRLHATINRDANGVFHLIEAGSRNGTTVNGRQLVASKPLSDGDRVVIGTVELTFRHTAAPKGRALSGQTTQFYLAREMVTVFVLDIRDFTRLSQHLGEEQVSALTSDFFRIGGQLANHRNCWAQKYIGDALMAVWRHPQNHVELADFGRLLDLVADFRKLAEFLTARFSLETPLRFGGALNTGYASTGNMGSEGVSDFTALGDAVNKAFRLEAGTKELHCDFLIAEETIRMVHPAVRSEWRPPLGNVMLKGYDAFEPIYAFSFDGLAALAETVRGAIAKPA